MARSRTTLAAWRPNQVQRVIAQAQPQPAAVDWTKPATAAQKAAFEAAIGAEMARRQAAGLNPYTGEPMPTAPNVDPFFTPEDIIAMNDWTRGVNDARTSWVSNFANAQSDTAYQKAQVDQAATKGKSNANDDAAARGIFQSSIRDATLYDIEAQRSMSQGMLDSKMKQYTQDYDNFVRSYGGTLSDGTKIAASPEQMAEGGYAGLGTEAANWRQGWNAKARGNAVNAMNAWVPPPPTLPTPAAPAAKPQTVAGATKPATTPTPAGGRPPAAPAGSTFATTSLNSRPIGTDTSRLPRRRSGGRSFTSSR